MRRRSFFPLIAAAPLLRANRGSVRLHIGNYGMQSMPVDAALKTIREIGYDGAELCLISGWPSEPSKLDKAARRQIREQPLPIPTMLENFSLLVSDADHAATLERIRRAAALGHDISPDTPPILQSVLGGKPSEWESMKGKMAGRLADWARTAKESDFQLAVKSHIGSASDTPEKLIWLLDHVRSPVLSGIYDYGHFQLLDLDLSKTMSVLLPRASFITVKDGRMVDGKPRFLLPGDGTVDYHKYFRLLDGNHYSGWMLVEVSRQLQTQPNYDPIAAAKTSYRNLAPLLKAAGLRA